MNRSTRSLAHAATAVATLIAVGAPAAGVDAGGSAPPDRPDVTYTSLSAGASAGTGGAAAVTYRPGCITRGEFNRIVEGMTDDEVVVDIIRADALSVLEGETDDGRPFAIVYWPHCRRMGESSVAFVPRRRNWVAVAKAWTNRLN